MAVRYFIICHPFFRLLRVAMTNPTEDRLGGGRARRNASDMKSIFKLGAPSYERDPTAEHNEHPGGIPVITERLPQTRSAAVSISVGIGSRDEGPKQHGMAHFLEHMLFKGTKNRTFNQVNETIEEAGGYLNAFTTAGDDLVLLVLDRRDGGHGPGAGPGHLLQPADGQGLHGAGEGVVKQEINNRLNDPERYIKNLLLRSLFKGGPLSRPVLGTDRSVDAFATEELLEFPFVQVPAAQDGGGGLRQHRREAGAAMGQRFIGWTG